MEMCDDCLRILEEDLSQEAIAILNKVELFNELSERDLVRKLSLNPKHLKKLLYELEAKLFLTYDSYGRTKAYHLTENGSRLLRLKKDKREVDVGLKVKNGSNDEQDNNNEQDNDNEPDNDNGLRGEEKQEVKKIKEKMDKEDSLEQKDKEEEKKMKDTVTQKKNEEEQKKDNQEQKREQPSDSKSENLVWDFK